jgi:hypothetical protein
MLMLVVQEVLVNQSMCLERLKCSEDSVGSHHAGSLHHPAETIKNAILSREGQSASKAAVP